MFIEDDLALDLGGVTPGTPQHVEIDRFDSLVDGEAYTLRFFFAQRQDAFAGFSLRTNLPLMGTTQAVTVSDGFD
jgi:fibro-slime domain-containing protein